MFFTMKGILFFKRSLLNIIIDNENGKIFIFRVDEMRSW